MQRNDTIQRPESETNIYVNAAGLGCFFLALIILNQFWPELGNAAMTAICLVALALPILLHDIFVRKIHTHPAAGLQATTLQPLRDPLLVQILLFIVLFTVVSVVSLFFPMQKWLLLTLLGATLVLPTILYYFLIRKHLPPSAERANWKRIGLKLAGLYATYALVAGVYWMFPEYKGDWYDRAYAAFAGALLVLCIGAPAYFWWVDSRQQEPEDSYFHLGRLLLTGRKDARTNVYLAEHARNWMVKGFFLPLMFIFIANNVQYLSNADYQLFSGKAFSLITSAEAARSWYKYFFDYSEALIYTVDVSIAAVGYSMTLRGVNAHIRSVEPTTLGWVICILCYPPFWSGMFRPQFFEYDDAISWGKWLWDSPVLYIIWGSVALAVLSAYSWATVAMGYRFSNLTYRGIITSGPYKFTKHPAYITKNTFFWLVSVPFLTDQHWTVAIQHCLLVFGVNLIYYARARTEERHLLNYPEYRQYCEWMDEHGWFRSLKRFSCFNWRTSEAVGVKAWWKRMPREMAASRAV